MLSVHWTTEYDAVANSFGYATHNKHARQALSAAGCRLDESAPVAVSVCPPHRFEPVPGKRNICYCAWEANELPELFAMSLADVDALCVTAEFLRQPFERILPGKPVCVVPLGVDFGRFAYVDRGQSKYRPAFNRKRPFRFLWVGAPNARKGALHVMEAWRAFEGNPAVELYIKTSLPSDSKVRVGMKRVGNVIYDDRKVPIEELVGIYHRAHCFVFPSVGEGFGLTMAEALATGLPTIYTPATSLVDFAPPQENLAYPVEFTWQSADWSWPDADARGTCMDVTVNVANADTTDLARKMNMVANDYQRALHRGKHAAEFLRQRFTWDECGRKLRRVVEFLSPAES